MSESWEEIAWKEYFSGDNRHKSPFSCVRNPQTWPRVSTCPRPRTNRGRLKTPVGIGGYGSGPAGIGGRRGYPAAIGRSSLRSAREPCATPQVHIPNPLPEIVELPDLPDVLKRYLECPICSQMPQANTPIFMCTTGHHLCSNCYAKGPIESCSICKGSFQGTRNLAVETVLKNVK